MHKPVKSKENKSSKAIKTKSPKGTYF
jgi:hypothetical protein